MVSEQELNEKRDLSFFETAGFSMWPFLRAGEKLVIKKTPIESLRRGDIILYRKNNQLVCHRLVRKVKRQGSYLLYSRADNSSSSPELIAEQVLLGRAIGILRSGRIISLTGRRQRWINQLIVFAGPSAGILARLCKALLKRK